MKLERVRIVRWPGIDEPFELSGDQIRSGLNLIVGPNGIGKTVVCRAVASILWPTTSPVASPHVESRWLVAGAVLDADRDGRGVTVWTHDAGAARPPSLPPPHRAHCYTLGVLDLVKPAADAADGALADEIRRRFAGGYDFEQVDAARCRIKPRFGEAEAKRLAAARRVTSGLCEQRRRLAREADGLGRLRLRRDALRGVAARRVALENALHRIVVGERLASARRELAGFPAAMGALVGNECERLVEIEADLERAGAELERARQAHATAEACLAEQPLVGPPLREEDVRRWRECARAFDQSADELADLDADLADARERRAAARRALDPDAEPESAPAVGVETVRLADGYLRSRAALSSERRGLESWLRRLERLRAPRTGRVVFEPLVVAHVLAVLLGVLGAVLGATVAAPWSVLVGVAMLGSAWAWGAAHGGRSYVARELEHRRLAERERIEDALAALRSRADDLDEVGAELRERVGVDMDLGEAVDVVELARRIATWREADTRLAGLRRRAEVVATRLDRAGEPLAALFRTQSHATSWLDFEEVGATTALEHLVALSAARERAERELARVTERKAACVESVGQLAARRQRCLAAAGVEDAEALRLRVARLDAYRRLDRVVKANQDRLAQLDAALDGFAELRELDDAELRRRLEQEATREQEFEELNERVGAVAREVELATKGDAIEQAAAAEQQAVDDLGACRDRGRRAAAAAFLLQRIRERHRREFEPEIASRANELFATFTNHAYELRLREAAGAAAAFVARNTRTERNVELAELSDGTRAQLLLAARLAFALDGEGAERVPLFLDETFAHCDAQRFEAIAGSLLRLLQKEERQLFCLTADIGDVQRWHRVERALGLEETPVIDLGEVRARAMVGEADYALPLYEQPPRPGAMTATAYAEALAVPPFEPKRAIGRAHLFHLLHDDLDVLWRLLVARVPTVGQWRSMRNLALPPAGIAADEAERIDVVADVAAAFAEAWRIGRGRCIDRTVLEQSEALTPKFVVAVAERLPACGRDAAALCDDLTHGSVKRLRSDALRALREFFVLRGYLDEREVLDAVELRERVLASVAHHIRSGRIDAAEVLRRVDEFAAVSR